MKRIISLVLVAIMVLTMLVGCGNGDAKPSQKKEFDLTELRQAMNDALSNSPKNFKYEHFASDKIDEMYIRRIQYRDGDKLKYWDYCTEKYIKDEKGAGGHFDFIYDYSKKTEADIKEDEWTYADKYDRNFYVIYFGWADTPTAVKSWFDDIKIGQKRIVKAENGVYGYYFYLHGKSKEYYKTEKPTSYLEIIVENGIQVKMQGYKLDENGVKTNVMDGWIAQTMFGEVSFEMPTKK